MSPLEKHLAEIVTMIQGPDTRRALIIGVIATACVLLFLADVSRPRIYVVAQQHDEKVTNV